MKKEELCKLLNELRSLPSETEWVEFKAAKIHNLLFELSVKTNKIKNIGSRKLPQWVLLKNNKNKKNKSISRKKYCNTYKFNLLSLDKINNKIVLTKAKTIFNT